MLALVLCKLALLRVPFETQVAHSAGVDVCARHTGIPKRADFSGELANPKSVPAPHLSSPVSNGYGKGSKRIH